MSCGGGCGGSCAGGCGTSTNPCAPGFNIPVAGVGARENLEQRAAAALPVPLCGTLAQSLIGVVDSARNLYTTFGLRPYAVRLIRTRWSGGKRGVGVESVVSATAIVPTPLISDISSLSEITTPVGLDEFGEVALTQISGAYTEDFLRGRGPQGQGVAVDEQLYFEVEFPPACSGADSDRRRFTLRGAPYYKSDDFQWTLRLERQRQDRTRAGDPR